MRSRSIEYRARRFARKAARRERRGLVAFPATSTRAMRRNVANVLAFTRALAFYTEVQS